MLRTWLHEMAGAPTALRDAADAQQSMTFRFLIQHYMSYVSIEAVMLYHSGGFARIIWK